MVALLLVACSHREPALKQASPGVQSGQAKGNFVAAFDRYYYVILNSMKQPKLNIFDFALTLFLVCAAVMVITR